MGWTACADVANSWRLDQLPRPVSRLRGGVDRRPTPVRSGKLNQWNVGVLVERNTCRYLALGASQFGGEAIDVAGVPRHRAVGDGKFLLQTEMASYQVLNGHRAAPG
jgi:hypothetical protein